MLDYFDQVHVINLDSRPERMESFRQALPKDWPFKAPERFSAYDETKTRIPEGYVFRPSVWGCLSSHYRIIYDAIRSGANRILVMEDDVIFVDGFAKKVQEFLDEVGDYWDGLWIGGEHTETPEPVSSGVVKCRNTIRTHMYALQGGFMGECERFIRTYKASGHVDRLFAHIQSNARVYAPKIFLAGQKAGYSDIDEEAHADRWQDWN
jgi:GR25 family glycosyltransferase involved in LPS biosynthesis